MKRIALVALFVVAACMTVAQSWMGTYEKGIQAGKRQDYAAARAYFKAAIAYRPEDASGATTLPGPVSERKLWRGGAPYSPNFLAAYCEYRLAGATTKVDEATPMLETAATEFETLLSKGQRSKETFYFLNQIYTRTGDTARRLDLENRSGKGKTNFRVDTEIVSPEEITVINGGVPGSPGTGPRVTVIKAGQPGSTPGTLPGNPTTTPGTGPIPSIGAVPAITTKYALIIGNGMSKMTDSAIPFAADDAQAVREALITHAGYLDSNVDLVLNATKGQILTSAKALADRVPEDGTVFIYFAGNGFNLDGKDFLAGVDTEMGTDSSTMVGKNDIYRLFMAKGAKIYAFFEVPRPIANGRYFGQEVPLVGAIAQVQSTMPGETVYAETHNSRTLGIFADALIGALQDIRSNRIAIAEFGWTLFNRIRGGGLGRPGGGSRQIPTLPVLTHLAPDDRF